MPSVEGRSDQQLSKTFKKATGEERPRPTRITETPSAKEDHCQSEEYQDKYDDEIARSYCKVRTVLLKINTDNNHVFHPAVVEAQRCVGHCAQSGVSCQATHKEKRRVQVTRKNAMGVTKCGQVEVEDHKDCDCL
ncbi:Protein of unknown function [Gryllus bimaculatus]|nr:Protein of unknown function [Gryllus bimaculatus]